MERDEMLRLFEAHRAAEAARDIDGILNTFVPDPFLETMALGLRSEGRDAVRAAYAMPFFSAFPDLAPTDEGMAFGDDTVVVWGTLRGTSRGDWLGVPAGGGTFAVLFANVVPFRDGLKARFLPSSDCLFLRVGSANPRLAVLLRRSEVISWSPEGQWPRIGPRGTRGRHGSAAPLDRRTSQSIAASSYPMSPRDVPLVPEPGRRASSAMLRRYPSS